ncbi:type II restriction enzyme NgoMIV [Desmospora sp. 8437]|nr:type II restriction enzyme NgoMIV [Desmospora sp. 8437]
MVIEMGNSLILKLRQEYHKNICRDILGLRKGSSCYNIADKDSNASVQLAQGLVTRLEYPLCEKPLSGQKAGALFGKYTMVFLEESFKHLNHIRPGNWGFSVSQAKPGIAAFDQYEHLNQLQRVLEEHSDLKAALGGDYLITPDIIVSRMAIHDRDLNAKENLVAADERIAKHTPLRSANFSGEKLILHASISCKWTMRSDRAQNTRTEALNLIRNRKGKTPHIVAVTFEPMPSRLSSIAMGTGDVDCTYHGALYELLDSAREMENDDYFHFLMDLVNGRRLRDISDLPFDLAQ